MWLEIAPATRRAQEPLIWPSNGRTGSMRQVATQRVYSNVLRLAPPSDYDSNDFRGPPSAIRSNKPLSKLELTSLYIQGNIPHACSFRPDSAELLYRSPGPAVIPSAAGVPSVRRFSEYRGASEASAVSFCDHPQDGAASPARALVTGFRIDSGGTNPLIPVFRESRLSATESSCARPFCSQKPLEYIAKR